MIKRLINEFRQQNGRTWLAMDHWQADEHCLFHCKHMAEAGCAHAPGHLLHGKAEAVAMRGVWRDHIEALKAIIFEDFAGSMKHRNILLFSDHIACAFHVAHNCVFVTVRGW